MFGLGAFAGNFAQGMRDENERLLGQRQQNARLWQEFRRNNPTASLGELSDYANQVSGGDSFIRAQFPTQAVMGTIAAENDERRVSEEMNRRSGMVRNQAEMETNIYNALARNMMGGLSDVDATEATLTAFGNDPGTRERIQRVISGLGSLEGVRQRAATEYVRNNIDSAMIAFEGGGIDAVNRQFATLPPDARSALARAVQQRSARAEEDRQSQLSYRGAQTGNLRQNTDSTGQATRRANEDQVLEIGAWAERSPGLQDLYRRGEPESEESARQMIRGQFIERGIPEPSDAQINRVIQTSRAALAASMNNEYQQRITAAQGPALTQATAMFNQQEQAISARARALSAPRQAALRSFAQNNYIPEGQVAAVFAAVEGASGTTEQILETIRAAAPNALPREAFINQTRSSIVSSSVGFSPGTAEGYQRIALSALGATENNIRQRLSEAQTPGAHSNIINHFSNVLRQEEAALRARVEQATRWGTTPFTPELQQSIAARIDALKTLLEEARGAPPAGAPQQPAVQGRAPAPAAPGQPAPRNGGSGSRERVPVMREGRPVSPEEADLTERYNRREIGDLEYETQMRALRARPQQRSSLPQGRQYAAIGNTMSDVSGYANVPEPVPPNIYRALASAPSPTERIRLANFYKRSLPPEMVMAVNDLVQQLNGVRGGSTSMTASNAEMRGWDAGIPAPRG